MTFGVLTGKCGREPTKHYIKQYEEDTNLRTTLLVDVSESMMFGSGAMTKYEYGCTVAAALAYLLLRQQDSVGLISFDDGIRKRVLPRSRQNHLHAILAALGSQQPEKKTDIFDVLRQTAEEQSLKGMVVIISDMFASRDGIFRGLKLLRHRGHDVLIFHILDDQELDFSYSGTTKFEGMEGIRGPRLRSKGPSAKGIWKPCRNTSMNYADTVHGRLSTTRRFVQANISMQRWHII